MANTVFASLESIVGKNWKEEREMATTKALSSPSSSSSAAGKTTILDEENLHPNLLMQTIKRKVIDTRRDLIPSGKYLRLCHRSSYSTIRRFHESLTSRRHFIRRNQ